MTSMVFPSFNFSVNPYDVSLPAHDEIAEYATTTYHVTSSSGSSSRPYVPNRLPISSTYTFLTSSSSSLTQDKIATEVCVGMKRSRDEVVDSSFDSSYRSKIMNLQLEEVSEVCDFLFPDDKIFDEFDAIDCPITTSADISDEVVNDAIINLKEVICQTEKDFFENLSRMNHESLSRLFTTL